MTHPDWSWDRYDESLFEDQEPSGEEGIEDLLDSWEGYEESDDEDLAA